ncbi:MAG: hypothetical protein ABEH56_04615 [Salinirussus sp.]
MQMASQLAIGSELLESLGQVAAAGATLVLVLMLVALGGYAYKQLRGDGVTWPEDMENPPEQHEDDGLQKGKDDDEWDYY